MRLKRGFEACSMTVKIVILFACLVIIPYIILVSIAFYGFGKYTVRNMSETEMDSMSVVGDELDVFLRQYEERTMTLYYGGYIEHLSEEHVTEINDLLNGICFADTHIHAAYLTTEDYIFQSGATYAEIFDVMKKNEKEIIEAGGKCIWYATNELRGSADRIQYVLARRLNNADMESEGILYLILDGNFISGIFDKLTGDYSERYLTDRQGNVLYGPGQQENLKESIAEIPEESRRGALTVGNGLGQAVLVYNRLDYADWYCISRISLSEIINDVRQIVLPFLILSVVYIVFLLEMLYMLRKYMLQPLKKLKGTMDDYAQGKLEIVRMEESGSGEFRELTKQFNEMTVRICNLMADYQKETEEKNRQKMKTLMAQLSPHFIYNTLNTIKWIAVVNKQKNIQNLIESLIYIIKNAARVDDDKYTVQDELTLIENYAVIQKARFMNFTLRTDVEDSCMQYKIPKLLLQPVVENAIIHGLGRGKEKFGEITVRIWQEEDILRITIEDNGIGFDVEKWKNCPEENEEHTNIGLHNIEEIIKMEYGEAYSLDIKSEPGKGTMVSYRLPTRPV